MSEPPTLTPETPDQPLRMAPAEARRPRARPERVRAVAMAAARVVGRALVVLALAAVLFAGLVAGGLWMTPLVAVAAPEVNAPPRRPPIVPPSVPLGAREDWAVWTYVDKINQAWGKDWPLVIRWFEELDARYPGNPMVLDKLYVSYLEDGRNLHLQGDLEGARRRYEQAARYDPDRGVAQERLAELDNQSAGARR